MKTLETRIEALEHRQPQEFVEERITSDMTPEEAFRIYRREIERSGRPPRGSHVSMSAEEAERIYRNLFDGAHHARA